MSAGLDYLLLVMRERGIRIDINETGRPTIAAPKGEATDAIREMMSLYRDELLAHFGIDPAAPPAPAVTPSLAVRLREWKWPSGMVQQEGPSHAAEDVGMHPSSATHWRYAGETEWNLIDRREPCGRN